MNKNIVPGGGDVFKDMKIPQIDTVEIVGLLTIVMCHRWSGVWWRFLERMSGVVIKDHKNTVIITQWIIQDFTGGAKIWILFSRGENNVLRAKKMLFLTRENKFVSSIKRVMYSLLYGQTELN